MPRKQLSPEQKNTAKEGVAEKLAKELKSGRDFGQPLIYEQALRVDRLRVSVIWDEWDRLPLDERTQTILRAYEMAEGNDYRNKIALAVGLTVPEATAAGMLPYQISTAVRRGDLVTIEECKTAMLAEGASKLFAPDIVQLRFATVEEAEACRKRLIQRLPQSENVWVISTDISVQDSITLHEASEASIT